MQALQEGRWNLLTLLRFPLAFPDPENMLVMLHTWQAGDCSDQAPYHGDFELAMKSIKAKTLVLPGKTDLYFPPEDSAHEVQCMTEGIGKCIEFPSIWGHWYVCSMTDSLDDQL